MNCFRRSTEVLIHNCLHGITVLTESEEMKSKGFRSPRSLTFNTVRQLAITLPHVEESTSYGTPAFKIKKKLFARLHQDGVSLVIHITEQDRQRWLAIDPETFYITDHYINYPWMLVRLATVKRGDLQALLTQAWRLAAPTSLLNDIEKPLRRPK